ncbi:MAG: RDD family protein [Myxococcaceae bacterium]|nr:RDD family protein [Myxococcaceae bacterium]
MAPFDDEEQLPDLKPAPIEARLKAGAFDLFILVTLMAGYFFGGLWLYGLAAPMWGVFAILVGYSVVPLSLFRATIGMRLFGIELVTRKGRNVPVTDLLFRELVGRGFFPITYLATLVFGLVMSWLGLLGFMMPTGIGFLLFHLSWMLLAAAVLGQFLMLTRPDRRSLADMVARSYMVPRQPPPPLPDDPDERVDALKARRGRFRTLVVAELIMVLFAAGLPWLMTRRTSGGGTGAWAERLKRERPEAQFARSPDDRQLASDLAMAYRAIGDAERERDVWTRYEAAYAEREKQREAAIRARVAKNPKDEEGQNLLLRLLLDQGRVEEAKQAYKAWVEADGDPSLRAGYGIWLYQRDWNEEAIAELTASFEAGFDRDGESYAFRGFAHKELGHFEEARADFEKALALDPDLEEDVRPELDALPPPPKKHKKVSRDER